MTLSQQLRRCRARNRMLQQQLSMRQTTPSGNHYLEHLFDKLAGEYNERIARLNTQKNLLNSKLYINLLNTIDYRICTK